MIQSLTVVLGDSETISLMNEDHFADNIDDIVRVGLVGSWDPSNLWGNNDRNPFDYHVGGNDIEAF